MSPDAPPSRFVIYASQRSGSKWLRDMLASHPRIEVKGELFLHRTNAYIQRVLAAPEADAPHWAVQWARRRSGLRRALRPRYVFEYLDRMFEPTDVHTHAVGFKLMYDQSCLHPEVLGYLAWRKVGVVHLVRENHLDVMLSQETRRLRDRPHATESVEQVQVHLDPDRLVARLRKRERAIRRATRLIRALRLPCVRLNYESIVADRAELARAVSFLGLKGDVDALDSELKKLNTAPHWQLIANYDAVRRRLADTPYAPLLQTPTAS